MSEEQLKKENDFLRGLVAALKIPCVYCSLENIAECVLGFPGCSRADDLLIGETERGKQLLEELRTLRKAS